MKMAGRLVRAFVLASAVTVALGDEAATHASASDPGRGWGYADPATGPLRWGLIEGEDGPAYPLCAAGMSQSPIDVSTAPVAPALPEQPAVATDADAPRRAGPAPTTATAPSLDPAVLTPALPSVQYGTLADVLRPPPSLPVAMTVEHEHGSPFFYCGDDDDCGAILGVDDKTYALKSVHFHTPAENTVDGIAYPMEMHMVHAADDGALAVLGVLFEKSQKTDADDAVAGMLDAAGVNGDAPPKGASDDPITVDVDPTALYDAESGYWRWDGSLTTPPCTEGVLWTLQRRPMPTRADAVEAFARSVGTYPGNARPTQPLNGRRVDVFEPAPVA